MPFELPMPFELQALVDMSILLLILIVAVSAGNTLTMGLPWGIGNRSETSTAPVDGWVMRTRRAYMNLLENLAIFAGLVIPAQFTGVSNEMTVLGAQLFVVGRLLHAGVYVAGITFLGIRTVAYLIGVAGCVLIFLQLISRF